MKKPNHLNVSAIELTFKGGADSFIPAVYIMLYSNDILAEKVQYIICCLVVSIRLLYHSEQITKQGYCNRI